MKRFAAILLLALPGCSASFLGDSEAACEIIVNAIHEFEARCNTHLLGHVQVCDEVLFSSNTTASVAYDCERELRATACNPEFVAIPESCKPIYFAPGL
jgi:hypothetical protein